MAEITHKELQASRAAAGLYQHQVAALMHVSDDTVSRWERGLQPPEPDQVDEREKLYKAPGLWYGWMRWAHASFRKRYPPIPNAESLAEALMEAKYQMEDLSPLHELVIRDSLDGKIDNREQGNKHLREMKEAHAALGRAIALYEGGTT